MWTLEVAIDDYMHTIARTRPWTMRREEEVLTPFVEWLYEQPGARVDLPSVTPDVVERYAAEHAIGAEQRYKLMDTLRLVFMWSEQEGRVTGNPFMAAAVS